MKVSFFPGCSLEGTAREFGESIDAVCGMLDIQMQELPDWSCCGASSAHATDEFLAVALPGRNLAIAERMGQDLVTPCAACFSRLKAAEAALQGKHADVPGVTWRGTIGVFHILEYMCREEFSGAIEQRVLTPLTGLNVLSYYGCLLVRPPRTTNAPHWEDPVTLDHMMEKLGARSIFWPCKTECCGGSLVLTNLDITHRLVGRILETAQETEADCIVTACPLCQSNIDTREEEIGSETGAPHNLPVFYFTELMGLAFGHPDAKKWFRRHLVDPRPMLKQKGLL